MLIRTAERYALGPERVVLWPVCYTQHRVAGASVFFASFRAFTGLEDLERRFSKAEDGKLQHM